MERFLFANIKVWVVALILIIVIVGAIFLSSLVAYTTKGGRKYLALGQAAVWISQIPVTAGKIINGSAVRDQHSSVDRHALFPGGFTFAKTEITNPQYVLLSRYDGDIRASVVELFREGEVSAIHRWEINDADKLQFESDNQMIKEPVDGRSHTMRLVHPWLADDGALFGHLHYGALYKFNPCGGVEWVNADFQYHHSLERGEDGNFWTVGTTTTDIEGQEFDDRFRDNHAVQVSADGEVLYDKSILEILQEAGLQNLLYDYDKYQLDPIHLNDVQPVLKDAKIAKRGDIYLSLGHINMVMLFRPSTDELIWWSQDRAMHQHDIDILGPDTIQVFNNRRKTSSDGSMFAEGPSEVLRYDLPDKSAKPFLSESLAALEFRTENQGLADRIPGSGTMLEETNYGRLVKLDENGWLDWTYVNRSEDGKVWTMNWSRFISKEIGAAAAQLLEEVQCPN